MDTSALVWTRRSWRDWDRLPAREWYLTKSQEVFHVEHLITCSYFVVRMGTGVAQVPRFLCMPGVGQSQPGVGNTPEGQGNSRKLLFIPHAKILIRPKVIDRQVMSEVDSEFCGLISGALAAREAVSIHHGAARVAHTATPPPRLVKTPPE